MPPLDVKTVLSGQVEYSIVPTINEHSLFMVREVDGRAELQVGSSLIGLPGVRHVKVKATDKGEQPLSTETEFTIIVTPERRFHPVHTYPGKEKYNPAPGDLPDIAVHKVCSPLSSQTFRCKKNMFTSRHGSLFFYSKRISTLNSIHILYWPYLGSVYL